ncbi:MAG: hypothetical protein K0R09_2451 [Clostridiales bacterium]|jgi:hypothetical protein|nr:hypothetical protein [Clostridiales bacterium]
MIYVYNCFAGTHSSVLAASYHLKKLPLDRPPTKQEILNIELFNKLRYTDRGKFFYHGKDEDGNKVFTIGRGSSKILVPALYNFFKLLDEESAIDERIIFSTTGHCIPLSMAIGGFTSVRLRFNLIGVPLLILGTMQTYKNIIKVVEHTKEVGANSKNKVELLENLCLK